MLNSTTKAWADSARHVLEGDTFVNMLPTVTTQLIIVSYVNLVYIVMIVQPSAPTKIIYQPLRKEVTMLWTCGKIKWPL